MKLKKKALAIITYSLCLFMATALISMATSISASAHEADDYIVTETDGDYGVMPTSDAPPPKVHL